MTYEPKLPARDYQARELERMRGQSAWALHMYMRTGKTKVVLDDYGRLESEGKVQDLLVIAPGGAYLPWADEVKKHLSDDLLSRVKVATWYSGKGISDPEFLKKLDGPRVFLVNVEALSSATGAKEACMFFLRDRKAMVAVDESTTIKGPKAKRTRFIVGQVRPLAKYRRTLSGLPSPRSPLDIYSQFYFLDPTILGHQSYDSFMHEYAIVKRHKFPGARWPTNVVTGYKNLDKLQAIVADHSSRVEFRPDIPPTWSIRNVPMTPEQQRAYRELKKYATTKLAEDSHVTATVVLSQMLKMHQILCGHVTDDNGFTREVPELKTTQLLEFLDDYSGKAVVWASYDFSIRRVADALSREYGPEAVSRFWGGNRDTREAEEKRFKEDPACRFMVATPSAGGRGRDWSVADLVVYYSSTYDLEHREQSELRVQAYGKKTGVDYVDLIAPDTVEVKILHALRNKIDLASAVTGANWREWVI